jgi:hypothetical protein
MGLLSLLSTFRPILTVALAPACEGECPDGKYALTTDAAGDGSACWSGHKVFCCDKSFRKHRIIRSIFMLLTLSLTFSHRVFCLVSISLSNRNL